MEDCWNELKIWLKDKMAVSNVLKKGKPTDIIDGFGLHILTLQRVKEKMEEIEAKYED